MPGMSPLQKRPLAPANSSVRARVSRAIFAVLLSAGSCLPAGAQEVSLSGFGTIGYAISDQPYDYARFINDKGTIKADTVLGLQADVKFRPELSATVQAEFAPAVYDDHRWAATLAWAFFSWQPADEWLVRLGKLRVPSALDAENLDVGATYDLLRYPREAYSLSPTYDFAGLDIAHNWNLDDVELSLEAYAGSTRSSWRGFLRDSSPELGITRGPVYAGLGLSSRGAALTFQSDARRLRFSIHDVRAQFTSGSKMYLGLPYGPIYSAPGGTIDGYGLQGGPTVPYIHLTLALISADLDLGNDFRLQSTVGRLRNLNHRNGPDAAGADLALLRRINNWTPYVVYAIERSPDTLRSYYDAIEGRANTFDSLAAAGTSAGVPYAALASLQRTAADQLAVVDQKTIALGTSYRLSGSQRLKFEWSQTVTGGASNFFIYAPAGTDSAHQRIRVGSMAYCFVF